MFLAGGISDSDAEIISVDEVIDNRLAEDPLWLTTNNLTRTAAIGRKLRAKSIGREENLRMGDGNRIPKAGPSNEFFTVVDGERQDAGLHDEILCNDAACKKVNEIGLKVALLSFDLDEKIIVEAYKSRT